MQRSANELHLALMFAQLNAFGENAPPLEDKLHMVAAIRGQSSEAASRLDRFLLEDLQVVHAGLAEAKENQEKLRSLLAKLTAAPWHPAIFLGLADADFGARVGDLGQAALVVHGNARRVVTISEDIDAGSLRVGDEVLLANELNVLMAKSPYRMLSGGETATFERYTADRRLVLKLRDEEIVVDAAGALSELELKTGDEVRFDRGAWLAYEKMERSRGGHLFLEEMPRETFADIGGLDRQIEELQRSIRLHFYHPDTVKKYRLQRKKSVLFSGSRGTGKTLTAKALANWLGSLSHSGRSRFINVKPAGLHSMWYGQTEANYREVFRVAREAGEREPEVPIVIFFDEVDAIGSARGAALHRIDDRVLNAFMAELNGLEDRGNVLVVTATNRLETMDPALIRPGRLGDLILQIPRPNRRAAVEIFRKHLHADIPYASNGHDPAAMRETVIESALAQLYASNSEGDLATLTFRDGKQRVIRARDLINGAEIAKIAQSAIERACLREAEAGSGGVALDDVLEGVADFFETAAQGLAPASCRQHIDDLPQDVDVVRVDKVVRKIRQPHHYMNVA